MEKNRSSKIIAIAALIVAVIGLSLGFAAFSTSLVIKPHVEVTPDSDTFVVVFSSSESVVETNPVVPVTNPTTVVAENATIDNADIPTISNLSATFSAPGQSATYTFYVHNQGEYDAFLKSITYANAQDASLPKVCVAAPGTDDTLVQQACNDITVSVQVGAETPTTGSVAGIEQHNLAKGTYETVIVTLNYADNNHRADGDFTVNFGDISLGYSSVDK